MPEVERATRGTRERYPMPEAIAARLASRGLWAAYEERPPYQRNDYLGWIRRATREETREKRVAQMLAELEGGELYMNMSWRTGRPRVAG